LRLEPIWTAIVTQSPNAGFPVFFPESVYVRMKTGIIANPASDWTNRLWAFYRLDVPAYHQALGSPPVRFLSINANPADAAWIVPGDCENHFGYWHLPDVRIVYEVSGVVRSFAVASLISWRSQWYVVHLGPNPRPSSVGTVALPSAGPGTPGPAGGC